MKTQTFYSKNSSGSVKRNNLGQHLCFTASVVVAVALWTIQPGRSVAADGESALATQIHSASVLYQPLMWVGDSPPSEEEDLVLATEIEKMKKQGVSQGIPVLEQFIISNADSSWVPSLRANLGRYYFENGRYTKALQSWELAWAATRTARSGPAKEVADFTFAYWTRLLASLGRVDTLRTLFQETQGRVFDGGSLQQLVNGAKEGYHMMLSDPGVCFKCGTYALGNVGRSLKGGGFDSSKIIELPSPHSGFSMTVLEELAQTNGLDLAPVQWGEDKTLVVPSVVHWKENHYVALLKEQNGHYLTVDPTFGKPRWLTASDIREEASGYFLVPKTKVPQNSKLLAKTETDKIFGRGYVYGIDDPNDGCGNGSGGGFGGGNGSGSPGGGPGKGGGLSGGGVQMGNGGVSGPTTTGGTLQ